ncbi:MAG: 3-hydroxyacyl-[acyl-carrier-protein] dehydratase FabA, partial [Deltaproteobacteria bacterium]|nr:3-hydroxyacyl-[acyl-carrier-protein] dehydratase FabA [Deltaproteobacteria bacterium]
MAAFDPIAVVGQACVLPGALDPAALWAAVLDGRDLLSRVPAGRWRLDPRHALADEEGALDRTWSDRGGYVAGFGDRFDATGFELPPEEVRALDPLFHWLLHCGRAALGQLGTPRARSGAIIGNLSFPSRSLAQFAERVWLGEELADGAGLPHVHPRNRFMSGLPAHLLARALGLGAGAFALDAACASSLYAIKLACDRLHDGTADLMLAGAVNGADDLFLHIGFCALRALSRSGQSRPFHRDADGLVPAEGAALVALKRLADARRDGDPIHGVIRGLGVGNDGRGRGLLAPCDRGQVRAMADAYRIAGLQPEQVSLIECHATGTPIGDAAEARSLRQLFGDCRDLPIGSLKSNLGHLITVAGVAGLLKVLGALRSGVRPPTRHAEAPIAELAGTPLRLLGEAEPWRCDGPRLAAVSAFGFGGNNAHLLVEEDRGPRAYAVPAIAAAPAGAAATDEIAIVALAVTTGDCGDATAFARALDADPPDAAGERRLTAIRIAAHDLRFPPADLAQALPQQLLILQVARDAVAGATALPRERTGIFIGMGCDAEVARYGVRWRLAGWAPRWGVRDPDWLQAARDGVVLALHAAGVVGTMPNIPANRLSNQFDVGGPSFTIASEELSGVRALQVAARALRARELDAALVGAVDLSCEPVHRAALSALGVRAPAGDAAVALVLKRLDDALRDGDRVLAVLGPGAEPALQLDGAALEARFGHAHAASGLLQVAAALLACRRGPHRSARIEVAALGGQRAGVELHLPDGVAQPPAAPSPAPRSPLLEFAAHSGPVTIAPLPGDELR